MRLDPVFLVAPEPEPPKVPTRRAFLLAGATFAAGAGLGGACGFAVGRRSREANSPEVTNQPKLAPTGDATLDELQRLSVAPIEELMGRASNVLDLLAKKYSEDEVLWQGLDRIAEDLINNERRQQRRFLARWVIQTIDRSSSSKAPGRRHFIPSLERIR